MDGSSPLQNHVLVTATRYEALPESAIGTARGANIIENSHLGWVVLFDRRQGILYSTPGATEIATFFRSAAKPFQSYPLLEAGYAAELTTEELAITCASHTGSQHHLELAKAILAKASLGPEQLQCGSHPPLDARMVEQLRSQHQAPEQLHNNCSGKHAGMLLYCQRAGLDTRNYLALEHPLQQKIVAILHHWGEIESIPLGIDGCGAPVFYLPLHIMAKLYAHLGTDKAFEPIRNAMTHYPHIIGGEGRIDTVLMQASRGQLLAKVGADGVLCVSRIDREEGLALKIADGSEQIRNLTLVEILIRLNWLDEIAKSDPRLQPYRQHQRLNAQNKPVGEYQIHFHAP
jgi:L-asparaginase II